MMLTSRARVVRSMDFMMTLFLGVMGELASLSGLKLKMLVKILFAAIGRRCISIPRVFSVAVITSPSLFLVRGAIVAAKRLSDLWSPCIISSRRSSSP